MTNIASHTLKEANNNLPRLRIRRMKKVHGRLKSKTFIRQSNYDWTSLHRKQKATKSTQRHRGMNGDWNYPKDTSRHKSELKLE